MTRKSRRDFIRASSLLVAGGAMTGGLGGSRSSRAFGGDLIRVGLIGCGSAGKETLVELLDTTTGPVKLVAMADAFGDRIQAAFRQLRSRHQARVDVSREHRFVGLDAYQSLLSVDLDLVVLAAPPAFLPLHFEAAVAAGKHVFMEAPVAVDAPGVRRVLQTGAAAAENSLAVAVGLRHRHEPVHRDTIAQLRNGVIGKPVMLRVYRNGGCLRARQRHGGQSELEYQLRNWHFFSWLGGDQIVERQVHNLDVGNWLMNQFPIAVNAQAACRGQRRSGQMPGDTCDQFFCEYSYGDGTRMFSQCRHVPNCWNNVSEHVHATQGRADISGGKIYGQTGERIWRTKGHRRGGRQQDHDLMNALRQGAVPNETDYAAKSTLTAIMGRMAARSGRAVSWEEAFCSPVSLADIDALRSLENPAPLLPDTTGI
ncbi:MAG: Gfo/Idh/MocA family protein [Planctomycetota bacterium]